MDTLGWLAVLVTAAGRAYIVKKSWYGYLIALVGGALWIAYSVSIKAEPLIAISLIYCVIDLCGLIAWIQDDN